MQRKRWARLNSLCRSCLTCKQQSSRWPDVRNTQSLLAVAQSPLAVDCVVMPTHCVLTLVGDRSGIVLKNFLNLMRFLGYVATIPPTKKDVFKQ